MRQYKLCIQNDNNNNNNNNNHNKMDKSKGRRGRSGRRRERWRERGYILFLFFSLFVSFLDLRKSDRRFLSGLKAKLIYATRATCGHHKVGVSTNSVR